MKTVWNWIQVVLAAIGGGLGWFFGEMDGFFYALIAFVVIDYLTGVMCAIIDKTLSSNVGFKGIFRKVLIFVMVGIGHVIDTQLIGSGDALRTAVIFFYISNEGVSLLEKGTRRSGLRTGCPSGTCSARPSGCRTRQSRSPCSGSCLLYTSRCV